MTRYFGYIVFVLLIVGGIAWVGLCGKAGGQGSAQPEQPPVSVLDKAIVGFAAYDEPLESVLRRLQQGEPDFVICFEWRIGRDPSGTPRRAVTVAPIEVSTLAEVLDAVTGAAEPGNFYTWYESPIKKDVVHILPRDRKERFTCLDVVIPRFLVEDVKYYEAFFALFEQPELADITPGWSIHGPDYESITLDLVNVTVRDALTHIVLATKSGIGWSVGGYIQDPPTPRFSFGRFGISLRPEELPYELRKQFFGNQESLSSGLNAEGNLSVALVRRGGTTYDGTEERALPLPTCR